MEPVSGDVPETRGPEMLLESAGPYRLGEGDLQLGNRAGGKYLTQYGKTDAGVRAAVQVAPGTDAQQCRAVDGGGAIREAVQPFLSGTPVEVDRPVFEDVPQICSVEPQVMTGAGHMVGEPGRAQVSGCQR